MFLSLLRARRFAPLFWCQFFSAFNDNFVRNMLAMVLLFRIGAQAAGPLITLAVGIFILPSIFLSSLGGEIADRSDKARIARRLKFAEIFVQMVAAAGFVLSSLPLLYAALFGLGIISALFGPIKYGILPDHLETAELPAGNALVEGATFLAILLGLIVGGLAAAQGRDPWSVVAQLMVVALACWGSARFIPATGAAAPHLKISRNIFAASWGLVRDLRQDQRLWIGGLAVSWFWLTGAVALSLVPVIVKSRTGGGIDVETAISALFAFGIGVGSVLAAVLSHGRITLLPTPVSAGLMGLVLIDLALTTGQLPHATQEMALTAFLSSTTGLHIALDVALLALAGGLFVVPIFSAVQGWAPEDRRARVIAGVNILNALFIVSASLLTAVLQSPLVGASEPWLLGILGGLNGLVGAWLFKVLPEGLMADFAHLVFRFLYRVEVHGLEHVEAAGDTCIIAVNHVSFVDAPVLLSVLAQKPVFAIDATIAKAWWVKPFLGVATCIALDPAKPLGTRRLMEEVRKGEKLVIFPEGRITVTGGLMKVYDGAALIADKTHAKIVAVRLEGLERTPFSRLSKAQVRRSWFPKVRVSFSPAQALQLDPVLVGRKRRQAAGTALHDIMRDWMFATTDTSLTLTEAFNRSVSRVGGSYPLLQDPFSGTLSASRTRLGAAVLAHKIAALSKPGEAVGLLLPNANGTAVTFMAVQQAGRVAAMLNYTAGLRTVLSACTLAQVQTVLTSRAFIAKAKLQDVIDGLSPHVRIVYLDDMRASLTLADKLRGFWTQGQMLAPRAPDEPAIILFTSGSEGVPKGVVLSHRNILANLAQICAQFDVNASDLVLNVLPVFHSFGLTGGLLLPLLTGMRCYLYPSPLHYRQIPELAYHLNATLLFGTDTFLRGYARAANPFDFRSLRYVVAGAEALKDDTRRTYAEQFGIRILEGYGVTETSPVVCVNTPMFNRTGTVGRLMSGIEARLEPVAGITQGQRLHLRGPNIMLGYLRDSAPGVLQPPHEGWHDTGDIARIDADGFVSIVGRAKRFAKIAGEMVSLAAVEAACTAQWPEIVCAVLNVPDARKGEKLVMVTTRTDITRSDLMVGLRAQGLSELMIPGEILVRDEMPVLGTGKIDLVTLMDEVRAQLVG